MHLRTLLTLLAVGAFASPAMGQGGLIGRSEPPSFRGREDVEAQLDRSVLGAVPSPEGKYYPAQDVPVEALTSRPRRRVSGRGEIIARDSSPILYAITHPLAARRSRGTR